MHKCIEKFWNDIMATPVERQEIGGAFTSDYIYFRAANLDNI